MVLDLILPMDNRSKQRSNDIRKILPIPKHGKVASFLNLQLLPSL